MTIDLTVLNSEHDPISRVQHLLEPMICHWRLKNAMMLQRGFLGELLSVKETLEMPLMMEETLESSARAWCCLLLILWVLGLKLDVCVMTLDNADREIDSMSDFANLEKVGEKR